MEYLPLPLDDPRADLIRQMWRDRMQGTKRKVEVGVHNIYAISLEEKQRDTQLSIRLAVNFQPD
jgi:hypothetical protein